MFDALTNLLLQNVNPAEQPTPNGRSMTHLQTCRNTPSPGRYTGLVQLIDILHPHGNQAIQHPIPLGLQDPSIILKTSRLNGHPPQEVFVVKVIHGVIEITHPWTVQTINVVVFLG